MWLSVETFNTVVASTPLVSIDMVIRNSKGEILLGERLNRPAKGFWFVPGGRVQKNETLDMAFRRLAEVELGQVFERSQAALLGVYEHFYSDSRFDTDQKNFETHYIVLGYQLTLSPESTLSQPPTHQHGQYRWWSPNDIQSSAQVHDNVRAYMDALR